ncbi:MAG: 4Fe-4S binding protein [Chloroflexota bacterium]|jgi:pyruvate ferredoxin oxidoreductase delta subunit
MKKHTIGTTISYPTEGPAGKTGTWRDFRPEIDQSKCSKCLLCWSLCPEGAIKRGEDDSVWIDYEYCKGCGICANECPKKAVTLNREA